jgi:hypothetical protein
MASTRDRAELGHKGTDGSSFKERVERFCRWGGSLFEARDFAPRHSATDIVVALLVEDGNPKRSTRNQIFKEQNTCVGICTTSHSLFQIECSVVVFAAQVLPLTDAPKPHPQRQIPTDLADQTMKLVNKARACP